MFPIRVSTILSKINKSCFHIAQTPLLIKANKLPPRPKFTKEMETEIEEFFLHGGRGAGGQKINKCNSKVQLKHVPSGIVVTCQETRSREQNREIARDKMALKVAVWSNDGQPINRQLKVFELLKQRKSSKLKKTTKKHELVKEQLENDRLKRDEEDRILLGKILNSNDRGT